MTKPSLKPHKKVTAAGAAGALVVVVQFVLLAFGIHQSPELVAAETTLAAFAAGYLKTA